MNGDPDRSELIAIIGGGFSGTMVAFHLARQPGNKPVRVVLIEKGSQFARGLAYGTRCDQHLLNVPAGLMSALPEEPTHFLDWLTARDPAAKPGTFAPRRAYGEYLNDLLSQVTQPGMPVELLRDEVTELQLGSGGPGDRVALRTSSGRQITCDRVVLAMGNQPPLDPAGVENLPAVKRYAADPWRQARSTASRAATRSPSSARGSRRSTSWSRRTRAAIAGSSTPSRATDCCLTVINLRRLDRTSRWPPSTPPPGLCSNRSGPPR